MATHLDRLCELIHLAATEADVDRLLRQILAAALEISGAERGFLVLVGGSIEVRASLGGDGAKISRTVLDRVLSADRPIILRDAELRATSLRREEVRAVCAVPLRSKAGPVGAVYLDHRSDRRIFGEEELRLLAALGAQAGMAIEHARLRRPAPSRPGILGASPEIERVKRLIEKFAPLPYPVLVLGESGTGKELVARALHAGGPFVAANLAAVPPALFESEMFGHVRGAFTGADADRAGLFEQARGGTLFLDEINSLPMGLQEKLLRVIQEREIRRVGSTQPTPVDVRLVAASNEDLERIAFRKDLFHRLNVLRVELPPLRDRGTDVALLADRFLEEVASETHRPLRLTPAAKEKLAFHDWPGNVRELENAIRRAAALSDGPSLDAPDFSFLLPSPLPRRIQSVDEYLRDTIARYGDAMPTADLASQLGVSRKTLWSLRKKFGLT